MKTKWITPRTEIEAFVPDEYIAVCWGVRCDINAANRYEKQNGYWDGGSVSHSAAHCGNANNQWIVDSDNDGTPEKMIEAGTELGDLNCTFYSDANYRFPIEITSIHITPNAPIYWTTSEDGWHGRTWHHQGYIINASRPNAS